MRLAACATAIAVLAMPAAATAEKTVPLQEALPKTVLALEGNRSTDFVVRLKSASLRRVSRRLSLGGRVSMWASSPSRRQIAFAVEDARGLRIVDGRRLKRLHRVGTSGGGITRLAWLSPNRIVGLDNAGAFIVDAAAGRLLRTIALPGVPYSARRAGRLLVTVLAPRYGVGPATLATIDDEGGLRTIGLDRIKIGAVHPDPAGGVEGEMWHPGLAVTDTGRAFVVDPGEIAEIDLAQMTLVYWTPTEERSLVDRLRGWLEPTAHAKRPDGRKLSYGPLDGRPASGRDRV